MFRRILFGPNTERVVSLPQPTLTGQLANSTKIGRFAKLLRAEIVEKRRMMNLVVFGDNLIGKSVKALCIAREGFDDTQTSPDCISDRVLSVVPCVIDSPAKQREDVISLEFLISSRQKKFDDPKSQPVELSVSSNMDYETLSRKLHTLYLKKSMDSFVLRCMGYSSAATIVKALGLFNQRVDSHKLHAAIRTESVPDSYMRGLNKPSDRSLRAIVFEVVVLDNTSD